MCTYLKYVYCYIYTYCTRFDLDEFTADQSFGWHLTHLSLFRCMGKGHIIRLCCLVCVLFVICFGLCGNTTIETKLSLAKLEPHTQHIHIHTPTKRASSNNWWARRWGCSTCVGQGAWNINWKYGKQKKQLLPRECCQLLASVFNHQTNSI